MLDSDMEASLAVLRPHSQKTRTGKKALVGTRFVAFAIACEYCTAVSCHLCLLYHLRCWHESVGSYGLRFRTMLSRFMAAVERSSRNHTPWNCMMTVVLWQIRLTFPSVPAVHATRGGTRSHLVYCLQRVGACFQQRGCDIQKAPAAAEVQQAPP